MPNWNQLLDEINAAGGMHDVIRRRYLKEVSEITDRNVIIFKFYRRMAADYREVQPDARRRVREGNRLVQRDDKRVAPDRDVRVRAKFR